MRVQNISGFVGIVVRETETEYFVIVEGADDYQWWAKAYAWPIGGPNAEAS